MPSRQSKIKRDWGRGMATAGKTKSNTSIPKQHFGPIPGVEVGMSWEFRIQCSEVGVHGPHVAGIAAQANNGCQSLVLAGGYEDDEDFGNEFTYTGNCRKKSATQILREINYFDCETSKTVIFDNFRGSEF